MSRVLGIAVAQSSVAHGGEALGAVTYLRRERVLGVDGEVSDIPIISGNAWRGVWRRRAADEWWRHGGEPKLTTAIMHAIWSGGALTKSSGNPLTGARVQQVRHLCPVVGVFGSAGGGRILDGCVQVGKLVPICEETRHIIPETLHAGDTLPSIWDLTQIEYFSKIPTRLEDRDTVVEPEEGDALPPARFGVETFVAGTRFATWVSLEWANPVEENFFHDTLTHYSANATLGGWGRIGMGHVEFQWQTELPGAASPPWRDNTPAPLGLDELGILAWLD